MSKSSQVEKIIKYMAKHPTKQWWYAPDFQARGMEEAYYVGYEASARMSDIMRMYPTIINIKREGKYRYIQLRPIKEWSTTIPESIRKMVREEQTGQKELV